MKAIKKIFAASLICTFLVLDTPATAQNTDAGTTNSATRDDDDDDDSGKMGLLGLLGLAGLLGLRKKDDNRNRATTVNR